MSANDKAAATYGRQPMSISQTADKLAAHRWGGTDANTLRAYCHCGWEANVLASGPAHREHQAEMLEPLIVGREQEAWAQGVKTTLNHAIDNDDGITLRLEHLDGRPWENPYSARAEQ